MFKILLCTEYFLSFELPAAVKNPINKNQIKCKKSLVKSCRAKSSKTKWSSVYKKKNLVESRNSRDESIKQL